MLAAIDVSVAVFVRGLNNLQAVLRKGEAYAIERGIDPSTLLEARLAADMHSVSVQAHWAAEGAKLAVARLLGVAPAPLPDDARTFAALLDRLDAAIASLAAVDADALEAGLARTIEVPLRGGVQAYRGDRFLTEFAVPGFFFHVTTAYAILRREGVPLTKGDFMGM